MIHKFICAAVMIGFAAPVYAGEYVQGYTRGDGTYVAPSYRSSPDSSYNNNYSVRPNVNPYTGNYGTKAPTYNDRPPSSGY
jgi:hypothetical protein